MFVKITLFKTDFDEENIFIPTNTEYPFFDFQPKMEDRLRLLKEKYEFLELPKSSYNPREPFRVAKNSFDIKGVYNYAVFDFDTEKGENENTPINKYRYYFIRDIVFVNDKVSQLIVKEDILPRVYNYIDIKQCLPESYTYKKSRIKKRDYKNLINDNIYIEKYGFSDAKRFVGENGAICQLFFIVCSCISSNEEIFNEDNTSYPFFNIAFPIFYNGTTRKVFNCETFLKTPRENGYVKILSSNDFFNLQKTTLSGFKVLSTVITTYIDFNIRFEEEEFYLSKFYIDSDFDFSVRALPFGNENYNFLEVEQTYSQKKQLPNDFFDDFCKIGYKKIVLSCGSTEKEIDPLIFLDKKTFNFSNYCVFFQSLVPPYNVFFGNESDFGNSTTDGSEFITYYNNFGVTVSNMLSAGSYEDAYIEFLRTNYNATITGLNVQQVANRELLAVQQGLQIEQFAYKTAKGVMSGVVAGKLFGASAPASAILGVGFDYLSTQATMEANRESLSINQEKENALLSLKLSDIQNTPDSASFYGSISNIITSGKYPRVTFWENVSLPIAKRGHKIFGFTLPQNINKIQSHYRFDYLRTKDLTLSFINGFSPTELERAEIEDTFNKGIRIWWTLDNYKNFDLENAEV